MLQGKHLQKLGANGVVERRQCICFILGWRKTEKGKTNIIQEAKVQLKPHDSCSPFLLTKQQFCAAGRGNSSDVVSACRGDSGVPVACKIDQIWVSCRCIDVLD